MFKDLWWYGFTSETRNKALNSDHILDEPDGCGWQVKNCSLEIQ